MTLPHERTRAVELAGEFLTDLLDPKKTPRVPRAIRDRALRILRHYPRSIDQKLDEANQLMHADYLEGHNASGLKEGDIVRVTRKAVSCEGGWDNQWLNAMDEMVGEVFTILNDMGVVGFLLTPCFLSFPYFVLEKAKNGVITPQFDEADHANPEKED